jgi:hypothetical protein
MRLRTKTRTCGLIFASMGFVAVSAVSLTALGQSYPLAGTLGSASSDIPANGSRVVTTTPRTGHFVLTEMCAGEGGALLSGSSVGFIALRPGPRAEAATPPCILFTQGFLLPPREKLYCRSASAYSSNCSVTWVLEKE